MRDVILDVVAPHRAIHPAGAEPYRFATARARSPGFGLAMRQQIFPGLGQGARLVQDRVTHAHREGPIGMGCEGPVIPSMSRLRARLSR